MAQPPLGLGWLDDPCRMNRNCARSIDNRFNRLNETLALSR
jgi:hypothetical protein